MLQRAMWAWIHWSFKHDCGFSALIKNPWSWASGSVQKPLLWPDCIISYYFCSTCQNITRFYNQTKALGLSRKDHSSNPRLWSVIIHNYSLGWCFHPTWLTSEGKKIQLKLRAEKLEIKGSCSRVQYSGSCRNRRKWTHNLLATTRNVNH